MADGEEPVQAPDWYDDIFAAVRRVPAGSVATYGQIADDVRTVRVTARQVGAALRYAPADVPWQRIVGSGGRLPIAKRSPELYILQRRLLAEEGVRFLVRRPDTVDMAACAAVVDDQGAAKQARRVPDVGIR